MRGLSTRTAHENHTPALALNFRTCRAICNTMTAQADEDGDELLLTQFLEDAVATRHCVVVAWSDELRAHFHTKPN